MKRLKYLISLVLILIVGGAELSVSAQQNLTGLNFALEAGFDGYVRSNTWSPIRILASNTGPDVTGEIKLRTNYPGETYAQTLSLPSQSQKEITLFMPLRGPEFSLTFVSEGETLFQSQQTARLIQPADFLIGVIASDPSLLNFLAGLQTVQGESVSVAHLSLDHLTETIQGLSALDVLIFNDIDTSSLSPNQQIALLNWVSAGGHLIVGGGPNGSTTASGLLPILPVADLTAKILSALPGLENYGRESIPPQGPYPATVPASTIGHIDVAQEEGHLLINHSVGQGQITYFALDFGLAPMNGWAGSTTFWENVLEPIVAKPPFYTIPDALRSLNNGLANISLATLPAPSWLISYLCLYILVLVPINYYILKRLKRRELAWLTIPVLILLFTLAGYIAGFQSRGRRALLRQISVIQQTNFSDFNHDFNQTDQANSGETMAMVDTFIGLYSPSRNRYTLKFKDHFLVQPTDGGNGFKGVRNSGSAPTTIYYGNQTELQNLWTDIGAMATAVAHGYSARQPISMALEATQQGNQWRISGIINNDSPQALEDAILLVGDYGLQLATLKQGTTEINQVLHPLDTGTFYSDLTIWGTSYYQLDDQEAILNDQIIRSIFWPNIYAPNQQPVNAPAPHLAEEIVLVGWQAGGPVEAEVEVTGQRVDRETLSLLIVRSTF